MGPRECRVVLTPTGFAVEGRWAYLLPENGRLILNFDPSENPWNTVPGRFRSERDAGRAIAHVHHRLRTLMEA